MRKADRTLTSPAQPPYC